MLLFLVFVRNANDIFSRDCSVNLKKSTQKQSCPISLISNFLLDVPRHKALITADSQACLILSDKTKVY